MGDPRRMEIRKARPEEAPAIMDMFARTVREICSKDYSSGQIASWLGMQRLDRTLGSISSGREIVCVNERSEVLGVGTRRGNEIRGLYVAADHQGEGIGSTILERLESDARAEGIDCLFLRSTLTALSYYLQKAYSEIQAEEWPLPNGDHLDVVRMQKALQ